MTHPCKLIVCNSGFLFPAYETFKENDKILGIVNHNFDGIWRFNNMITRPDEMNLFTLIILVLQQEFLTAVLWLHVSLGSFTLNLTKTFLGWILEILFYDTVLHAGFFADYVEEATTSDRILSC